jgi:epoxyqueuosine reductase
MMAELNPLPYTIDPQVLVRFEQKNTAFGRRLWDQSAAFYGQAVHERAGEWMAGGQPGYSRLEFSRLRAAWTVYDHFGGAFSWERLEPGDPLLNGMDRHRVVDRAEMSAQVKDTARAYGASLVGICELDRRWVYASDVHGRAIEIPDRFRYAIVMAIAMDTDLIQASPAYPAGTATGVGYSRMAFGIACLAEFIRNLGYDAIPMGNDTALSIPLAIDAGLGELGRNGLLVTPQYGPCVRLCKVFTDLPLAPDQPVGFGVAEVCRGCRRCAESCGVEAISFDPQPSFQVVCPSNNRGIRRWAVNHDRCYSFWVENGASCSTCIATCPYTQRAAKAPG